MITIKGKALGTRKPLFDDFSIPPPGDMGDGGPLTLRALITHVVAIEVQNFAKRDNARRFDRVLSARQIDAAEQKGKISPEARARKHQHPRVDLDSAIATALEAFTDGLYLVVIDDLEYTDLDAIVHLKRDSRITFIRLTFLAGA